MSVTNIIFDPEGDLLLRLLEPKTGSAVEDKVGPSAPEATSMEEFHMLVSSKHLKLASPVFRAMFQPGFLEGQILQSQARAQIDMPDDDPEAFGLLMNAIHGLSSKMPITVNLKTLTALALVVDKYQSEATFPYAQRWCLVLGDAFDWKNAPMSGIVSWLCICWVFKMPQSFKMVSRVAERRSSSRLKAVDLPLPEIVLDRIEAKRQSAIDEIIQDLNLNYTKLSSKVLQCRHNPGAPTIREIKFACDSKVLGTLIKGLATQDLWPLPKAPYEGLSFDTVVTRVRDAKFNAPCTEKHFTPSFKANKVEKDMDGLDLDTLMSVEKTSKTLQQLNLSKS
ncbi:uncharacterized protein LY89DRAFT_670390 [Mollisia scopiformis]|uniref:BTB domain-containing protein n=1 Tax=Mollisia scopiformis TaxID=149040 RepID=A0A194X6P8_MOLSC|nr:uncharacterized protein LY89DRAFT_670390 [Mollisia scopiformis]KUJ15851.1 hypothetical protein LY89DRAFT_670390 [Mollisia scopiformis]